MIPKVNLDRFDTEVYWLALNERHNVIRADRVAFAEKELGSMSAVWTASPDSLRRLGFHDFAVSEFFRLKSRVYLDQLASKLETLRRKGVRIIKYTDDIYPELLRTLSSQREGAPLILFHRGALLDFDRCVAVVGTRVLSCYGHFMARRIARSIAAAGYTVVSGLARGTDIEAHCGALEAKHGKTIAVLPWLEPLYPPEHAELLKDVEKKGAVVSEHYEKISGKPALGSFVERNRITSGISRCVIAVESDEEGGTVHQVRFAINQGRKVFAVKPKSDNARAMRGFRNFVKMGATAIVTAKPVVDYLRAGEKDRPMDVYIDSQSKL